MCDVGQEKGAIADRFALQFLRFAVVGLAGFALDAGLTTALAVGGLDPRAARVPAILTAMLLTWWLNRGFTFRTAAPLASVLPYLLVAMAVAALNYLLFVWLIGQKLSVLPAVAAATGVSMLLSFVSYRSLVFRGENSAPLMGPDNWTPSIVLLLGVAWIAAHPYAGLRHDAVYYALDALFNLDPAPFEHELFFQAGSPYAASLLGLLYARLVDLVGTTTAARGMFVSAQLLWAVAAICWSIRILPSHKLWILAPLLFLIPHAYDSDGLLRIAELHFTARSVAEPLTLLGLLAIIGGRRFLGWGLLVLAAITHPIMALPGWGCGLWCTLRQRGWSTRYLLGAMSAAFALVALASAQAVFGVLDDEWLALIARRNAFVVPSQWGPEYAARVAAPVLVLLAAARFLPAGQASLHVGIAMAALAGVLLASLGEFMRAALLLQAQPWRTTWLALWAAPFASTAVAWSSWQHDRARSLLFIGAIPAALLAAHAVLPWIAWLPLAHAALLWGFCIDRTGWRRWGSVGRAVVAVLGAVLSVLLGAVIYAGLFMADEAGISVWRSERELIGDTTGWLLAPLLLGGLWYLFAPLRRDTAVGRVLLMFLLGLGLSFGDVRNADRLRNERWIESGLPALRSATADAGLVMWPEHVALTWLALRRPGYVSVEQTAPAMFDRGVAREGYRRMTVIGSLGGSDGLFDHRKAMRGNAPAPVPDPDGYRRMCADRPAAMLVLASPLFDEARPVSLDDTHRVWVHQCGSHAPATSRSQDAARPEE